ncbi:MAG: hypothetical protein GWO07_14970 [Candidatus Dadabacteria bacterium]|nr:hypothetical protein [Candidatus Dadabacteria bacterium]NIS10013.1 hypothetical protein [Candidatus Dadabacteria bacterium]NIV42019.1 hypothetical protein [Candidatus Dadabacteria bacterium]NIX15229.1 hypothetical protein [Candidatus Dadabacteria bacterium]NIY22985.1 hypothetical protein [Candidatus Dadabacteria bacterium]
MFLIGLIYSKSSPSVLSSIQILLFSFPYAIFLFGINDINDYESDKLNPRKKSYVITREVKRLIFLVSILTSVLLILTSVLTLNIQNIVLILLIILISYLYSSGPFRFKELPLLDSFSNGLLFFLVFVAGFSYGGSVADIPVKIYFVAFCVMGIHAFGTVLDYEVDRNVGHNTFAVYFGKRIPLFFCLIAFLSSFYFAGIGRSFINYYFLYCATLTLAALTRPVQKITLSCFKLIFAGFIVTSIVFLVTY